MRALLLRLNSSGSSPCLILDMDASMPSLTSMDVLLEVRACAVSDDHGYDSMTRDVLTRTLAASGWCGLHDVAIGMEVSGVVAQVGSKAKERFNVGDDVVGLLPMWNYSMDASDVIVAAADTATATENNSDGDVVIKAKVGGCGRWGGGGCADYCAADSLSLVKKPLGLRHADAAACIGPGVRAYTALVMTLKLCKGDTLVVLDAASIDGQIAVQLARNWGIKVIAIVGSTIAVETCKKATFGPQVRVIDTSACPNSNDWVVAVMVETGGLGADGIIDSGLLYNGDNNTPSGRVVATKKQIISALAVHGRWATRVSGVQLDPPDCELLFVKGASVSFVCEQSWVMSGSQQGRFLHILEDLMNQVVSGGITTASLPVRSVSFECALEAIKAEKTPKQMEAKTRGAVLVIEP